MAGNGLLLFSGMGGVAYIAFGVTENFNIFNIVGEYLGQVALGGFSVAIVHGAQLSSI